MKITKTKKEAMQYHSDISQMKGTIYEHYFASKNRQFYNDNKVTLDGIIEQMNTLHRDYFELTDGKINQIEVDGKKQPQFKEGKTNEAYMKDWNELMGQPVTMVL